MSVTPTAKRSTAVLLGLLVGLSLLVYLAGNGRVPLWDRDEPRYAQTSKQMIESGDWVVPRLLDKVRNAKPVLIYWLQGASMRLFGTNEWSARLPSALASAATLAAMGAFLWRRTSARVAVWSVFVLATSLLFMGCAKLATTDAVLVFFIATAELALVEAYLCRGEGRRGGWAAWVFWIACAGGLLTKGPVILGVLATSLVVLLLADYLPNRKSPGALADALRYWRNLRPLRGAALLLVLVLPWVIWVEVRHPGFLWSALSHDVIKRASEPLEGHRGPPGYYLVSVFGTFFPWSLLLPTAIVFGFIMRREPLVRLSLAMVIGPWLMFELVSTKLVHYLLPVFPWLAILTARAIEGFVAGEHKEFRRKSFHAALVLWALGPLAMCAMPLVGIRAFPYADGQAAVMVGVVGLSWLAWVALAMRRDRYRLALAGMGLGSFAMVLSLYLSFLPGANYLWLSRRVGAALKDVGAVDRGEAAMIEYAEDSVPFYQGGTIRAAGFEALEPPVTSRRWVARLTRLVRDLSQRLEPPPTGPRWAIRLTGLVRDLGRRLEPLPAGPRWVILPEETWLSVPQATRDRVSVLRRMKGVNLADGGKITTVLLVRVDAATRPSKP